jgi:hypothetical protein
MLKYLVSRSDGSVQQHLLDAARARIIEREAQKKQSRKRTAPWMKWPEDRKRSVATAYRNGGICAVRLLSSEVPPKSTLRGWCEQMHCGELQPTGRPRLLTAEEEQSVLTAFRALRQRCYFALIHCHISLCFGSGSIVDREILILLGQDAAKEFRGAEAEMPVLGEHWVKSFRSCHLMQQQLSPGILQAKVQNQRFASKHHRQSAPYGGKHPTDKPLERRVPRRCASPNAVGNPF